MDRSTEKLVEQMTQGERACAALDRAVRELRRFQREAVRAGTVPALAIGHSVPEGTPAPDGDIGV
jgi:hypothetical protein